MIVLVLSWMIPLVSLIIVLTTGERPFIFRKEQGKSGIPFQIYKFRSMKGVPPVNDPLLSAEESNRITKFGFFIRKFRIDEFPQFINVFMGQMSVVGPRPERQYFLDRIVTHIPRYKYLQKLRPGISPWVRSVLDMQTL